MSDLVSAIQSGDVEKLTTVPGIGKKSASRLVLELKDKVENSIPASRRQAIHPGRGKMRPLMTRCQRS